MISEPGTHALGPKSAVRPHSLWEKFFIHIATIVLSPPISPGFPTAGGTRGLAARLRGIPNSEPILYSLVVPFTDSFTFAVLIGFALRSTKEWAGTQAPDPHSHHRNYRHGVLPLAYCNSVP
jgi:hypothetical protein